MRFSSSHILLAAQWTSLVSARGSRLIPRASTPSPIPISPSQNWDGIDGPWSSFTLQVGTPIQNVRVFVSTANSDTWVVRTDGCVSTESPCEEARGRTFNPDSSTTWDQHGIYELGFQQSLGLKVPGVFGNDTLGLGIQGSGGPILKDHTVVTYTDEALHMGVFGLNPSSTNFSATDQGRPSYMSSLKTQNLIPSLSFGYTAGNQYRLRQVYGSLTLGGYDLSLFTPNSLTIPFAEDPVRNLLVGLQSISIKGETGAASALLPTPITANVDSTVPMIWLPREACEAFEKAFGLAWDDKSDLYLVDDDLHKDLQRQNASVTFTIGAASSGGQTTDIVLPYDSFDLLVKPPFKGISESQKYFPLRRALNATQYTLGRTFLQEAYLTVDWERRNFSISQCIFSNTAKQNLVAITSPTSSSSGLSTSAKIGVAVGTIIVVILLAIATFILRRRKANRAAAAAAETAKSKQDPGPVQGFLKGELGTGFDNTRFEMEGSDGNALKDYTNSKKSSDWIDEKAKHPFPRSSVAEIGGSDARAEVAPGGFVYTGKVVHEMYDPSWYPPVELPASRAPEEEEEATEHPTPTSPRSHPPPTTSPFSNPPSPLESSRPPTSSSSRPSPLLRSFSRRHRNHNPVSEPSTPSSPSTPRRLDRSISRTVSPPMPQARSSEGFVPSPVSRQGTFSPPLPPLPVVRWDEGEEDEEVWSPISPSSPPGEEGKGVFARFRG